MVGEFPELQGIMGEYYAKHDGEPQEVALAIREHYQPRYAGDALPSTSVSLAVAMADKLETLVGMFGIGQMPTGEKDPFALRRHALGVLRMLIEKNLTLSLTDVIDDAWAEESQVPGIQDHRAELRSFFMDRLRVMLRDMGYSAVEVEAVLSLNPSRLNDVLERLKAVRSFMALPESASLTAANKRINNILKKVEGDIPETVNPALFQQDEEKALYEDLLQVKPVVQALFDQGNYEALLSALAPMKKTVDGFFEHVMVNAEDPALRANRQALLKELYSVMNQVADIARLAQ